MSDPVRLSGAKLSTFEECISLVRKAMAESEPIAPPGSVWMYDNEDEEHDENSLVVLVTPSGRPVMWMPVRDWEALRDEAEARRK